MTPKGACSGAAFLSSGATRYKKSIIAVAAFLLAVTFCTSTLASSTIRGSSVLSLQRGALETPGHHGITNEQAPGPGAQLLAAQVSVLFQSFTGPEAA